MLPEGFPFHQFISSMRTIKYTWPYMHFPVQINIEANVLLASGHTQAQL